MNRPQATQGPLGNEFARIHPLSGGQTLIISSLGITIHDPQGEMTDYGEALVGASAEQAIEAAKAILVAYDVPFCNRVGGRG